MAPRSVSGRRARHVLAWVTALLLVLPALLGHVAAQAASGAPALAARIAELAADPATVRLTTDAAVTRLRPIVPLAAAATTEAARTYSGRAADAGIAWAQLDYQAGRRKGSWEFLALQIAIDGTTAQHAAIGTAVAGELARRLGKPRMPSAGKAERLRIWRAGGHRVVTVREGTFPSPIDQRPQAVVLVEVVVEQGEED